MSPEWEAWYANGGWVEGWSPNFTKMVKRFVVEADKLLELGPGCGGNIRALIEYGLPYSAIEGSPTAVKRLHENFPQFRDAIVVGDFTKDQPFGDGFDVVIDRASVPHNDSAGITRCLDIVWDTLKPGGLFISSDWFSTWHSEYARGEYVETGTRTGYEDGQFAGVGVVHFSDERDLTNLFARFDRVFLEERIMRRVCVGGFLEKQLGMHYISPVFDGVEYRRAVWDLVARRPY